MAQEITASRLRSAGLSRSFADHVIAGTRQISVPLALWLFENDQIKVGPLEGKSAAEVRLLRSMYEPSAPASVIARRSARPANDTPAQGAAA